ncbi:hypothetical protein DPEC_G00075930 [Dallia pectoralis]|uniref:Uncharacterized protein n=1 Tax=Dallia pectoralis TaxID=75939 RepID=A0ACC2H3M6_DALPE|nr:hypothetical protein DPEC_G00075930 [Dallia pectoralis]
MYIYVYDIGKSRTAAYIPAGPVVTTTPINQLQLVVHAPVWMHTELIAWSLFHIENSASGYILAVRSCR